MNKSFCLYCFSRWISLDCTCCVNWSANYESEFDFLQTPFIMMGIIKRKYVQSKQYLRLDRVNTKPRRPRASKLPATPDSTLIFDSLIRQDDSSDDNELMCVSCIDFPFVFAFGVDSLWWDMTSLYRRQYCSAISIWRQPAKSKRPYRVWWPKFRRFLTVWLLRRMISKRV